MLSRFRFLPLYATSHLEDQYPSNQGLSAVLRRLRFIMSVILCTGKQEPGPLLAVVCEVANLQLQPATTTPSGMLAPIATQPSVGQREF